jgi:hypothetical protein
LRQRQLDTPAPPKGPPPVAVSHTTDLPNFVPAEIAIGETVEFEKNFDDFPADEWTVTYYFRGAGPGFNAVGTADGTTHVYNIPTTDTDDMLAGRYDYQAFAVKDAEKHLVDAGTTKAKASLASIATTATYDGRSLAKQILDAIDNLMKGKATLDQQKFLIASGVPGFTSQHEAERIQPTELLELRKYYAAIVKSENRRKSGNSYRTIQIQFDEPS